VSVQDQKEHARKKKMIFSIMAGPYTNMNRGYSLLF